MARSLQPAAEILVRRSHDCGQGATLGPDSRALPRLDFERDVFRDAVHWLCLECQASGYITHEELVIAAEEMGLS